MTTLYFTGWSRVSVYKVSFRSYKKVTSISTLVSWDLIVLIDLIDLINLIDIWRSVPSWGIIEYLRYLMSIMKIYFPLAVFFVSEQDNCMTCSFTLPVGTVITYVCCIVLHCSCDYVGLLFWRWFGTSLISLINDLSLMGYKVHNFLISRFDLFISLFGVQLFLALQPKYYY